MKYLGIVDGTMGILSRKMALKGNPVDNPTQAATNIMNMPSSLRARKASHHVTSP